MRMHNRLMILPVLAGLGLALAAGPVCAAEDKPAHESGDTNKKAPKPGTSVEMPYLIAPIIVAGRLQGYAYVSSKIIAASPSAALAIRGKIPFIQDAFVRDVNKTAIGKADDPGTVDKDGLIARLLADTRRIMGEGKVTNLEIMQMQISPLKSAAKH